MQRNLVPLIAIAAALSIGGCNMPGAMHAKKSLEGTGGVKAENRQVSAFDRIAVEGNFRVNVHVGPTAGLSIKAQENLLREITTEVKDKQLIVRSDYELKSAEPILVTISVPTLLAIDGSGAASFNVQNIAGEDFTAHLSGASKLKAKGTARTIQLHGSGGAEFVWDGLVARKLTVDASGGTSILLSGQVDELALNSSGGCSFKGENLKARSAAVDSSGGSAISVNAAEMLSVNASGGGRVRYIGDPKLNLNVSGGVDVSQSK